MSIVTRPTAPGTDSLKAPNSRRIRPVSRTIAGSVAAGAAAALGLTLGAFPGATESVTTGAVLLAFGFGWALLAVLSTRRTSHPQTWALVPAGAMVTAGMLLCAFRPGNAALAALNWAWPVAMAALVVWMIVQIKR